MSISRPLYQDDKNFRLDIDNLVYVFDSSTISLCLKLCPRATFRDTKGGIKMHTLLDLRGNLPVFVRLTEASVHDVNILDELNIKPAAIYVVDKAYVDFFRLFNGINGQKAFFFTVAKDNMQFEMVSSEPSDIQYGVISDEMDQLTGSKSSRHYPERFRMVTYEDFTTNEVHRFITNNTVLDPLTISEPYRERWQVELFFYVKEKIMQSSTMKYIHNQVIKSFTLQYHFA